MFVRLMKPDLVNGVAVPLHRIIEVSNAEGNRLLSSGAASEYVRSKDGNCEATLSGYEIRIETRRFYRVVRDFANAPYISVAGSVLEMPESVGDELAAAGLVERAGMPATQPPGVKVSLPEQRY